MPIWLPGRFGILTGLCSLGALLALASALHSVPAQAGSLVDVELVIAADVSTSMTLAEKKLQQQGFVQAFRDRDLIRTILNGKTARIAVTYVEWGGYRTPKVVVPWTIIDGEASSLAFAQRLETNFPSRMPRGTAIGTLLEFSSGLLAQGEHPATRSVINISGDGIDNKRPDLRQIRQSLLDDGVTINGLPLAYRDEVEGIPDSVLDERPPDFLIRYYRDEVIGGTGAFVEPVVARDQFSGAILKKLMREIGGDSISSNSGGTTCSAAFIAPCFVAYNPSGQAVPDDGN